MVKHLERSRALYVSNRQATPLVQQFGKRDRPAGRGRS